MTCRVCGSETPSELEVCPDNDECRSTAKMLRMSKTALPPELASVVRAPTERPQKREESAERFFPLGFGPVMFKPCERKIITAEPQVPFKGSLFVVAPESAPHFLLEEFRIAHSSHFVNGNPIACSCLLTTSSIELALASGPAKVLALVDALGLDMRIVQPGEKLTLYVTNMSGSEKAFFAALYGTSFPNW